MGRTGKKRKSNLLAEIEAAHLRDLAEMDAYQDRLHDLIEEEREYRRIFNWSLLRDRILGFFR